MASISSLAFCCIFVATVSGDRSSVLGKFKPNVSMTRSQEQDQWSIGLLPHNGTDHQAHSFKNVLSPSDVDAINSIFSNPDSVPLMNADLNANLSSAMSSELDSPSANEEEERNPSFIPPADSTRSARTPSRLQSFMDSYAKRRPQNGSFPSRRLFVGGSKRGSVFVWPTDLITAPSHTADLVVSADLGFFGMTSRGDAMKKKDPETLTISTEDNIVIVTTKLPPLAAATLQPLLKRAPLEESRLQEAQHPSSVYRVGLDGVPVSGSTYFPINLKESSVYFGSDPILTADKEDKTREENRPADEEDEEEEDSIEFAGTRLTTEKLAYLLIGACCALSILCLVMVAVCLHCRRSCAKRRLRRRLKMGPLYSRPPYWRHQGYFSYFHHHQDSSCSSFSCDGCGCPCTAWTLGARNLDSRFGRGPYGVRRGGPRKLPFGTASSLHFQTVGGLSRGSRLLQKTTMAMPPASKHHPPRECECSDMGGSLHTKCSCSSGLPGDDSPPECTCIRPTSDWDAPQWSGAYGEQPPPSEGSFPPPPPPVTGSNYLTDAKGVVFWSANDERLI